MKLWGQQKTHWLDTSIGRPSCFFFTAKSSSAFYFEHEVTVARKNARERKKPHVHLISLVVVS